MPATGQGEGLIGAAEAASEEGSAPPEATSGQESRLGALEAHVAALEGRVASLEGSVEASQLLGSSGQASTSAVGSQADDVAQHAERARRLRRRGRDIKLVCIDMDGAPRLLECALPCAGACIKAPDCHRYIGSSLHVAGTFLAF